MSLVDVDTYNEYNFFPPIRYRAMLKLIQPLNQSTPSFSPSAILLGIKQRLKGHGSMFVLPATSTHLEN